MDELNDLASKKLGFCVRKESYSQVDLQPAYGVIFEEFIKGYDFWGHCDIDVVWGDIREFLSDEILRDFDIISFRKDFTAGHFTLWRNVLEINSIFKSIPDFRILFSCPGHHNFDENIISSHLKRLSAGSAFQPRIYWPENLVIWFAGTTNPVGWYWRDGKVFDASHRERIYVHFQAWKDSIQNIDFEIGDEPETFGFNWTGIFSRRPSLFHKLVVDASRVLKNLQMVVDNFPQHVKNALHVLVIALRLGSLYWARQLKINSISVHDVNYDRKKNSILLKDLRLSFSSDHEFLLTVYNDAKELLRLQNTSLYFGPHGDLFLKAQGLRIQINGADDVREIKKLLVDGIYNISFSRPTIVLDVGMGIGFSSLYFAAQPNVTVFGFEPCEKPFHQALQNFSLNPERSKRIHPVKVAVAEASFRSIAMLPPKKPNRRSFFEMYKLDDIDPIFEYEEVEAKNVVQIVDEIAELYPSHDIVLKVNCENQDYYIEGVSEFHIIGRLHQTDKLSQLNSILLEWHEQNVTNNPSMLIRLLNAFEFETFAFAPYRPCEGLLYAVRKSSSNNS